MSPSVDHRQLWFLNTHVTILVSHRDGTDGMSVLEHRAPHGDSPPLHVHSGEDEIFYVIDGEVRFRAGEHERVLGAGESILTLKTVPHTYRVLSAGGARMLTVTRNRDFEEFVRAMGSPSEHAGLPTPVGPPSPEQFAMFLGVAQRHNIDLVGPPLS
jgi:quercetin dioxygenase-like cupin family protein